jgi:hypothetical protein
MTSKFAGLKAAVESERLSAEVQPEVAQPAARTPKQRPEEPSEKSSKTQNKEPWVVNAQSVEQIKILNGRVPKSVKLNFGRQITDAEEDMNESLTLDVAIEAIARLVIEDEEVRRKWKLKMWELRKASR